MLDCFFPKIARRPADTTQLTRVFPDFETDNATNPMMTQLNASKIPPVR